MLTYFDAVWSVGRRLHRGVAIDLGLVPDFFEDKLDQPMATLRLLHYPPQPAVGGRWARSAPATIPITAT